MKWVRQISIIFIMCLTGAGNARAQLWRYLNDSPGREAAFERELEREASSVVTRHVKTEYYGIVAYKIMTYRIRTFDSATDKITIFEKPDSHSLSIQCPKEKLTIGDFRNLAKIHFLAGNLLEVVFSPRGGSDEGYDNVLILGIKNGKFCVVLSIWTVDEYEMPDECGLYNVRLKLSGQNTSNYQLAVNIHELLKSSEHPARDFDHTHHYILQFDDSKKVFYNEIGHLHNMIGVFDSATRKNKDMLIDGDYPAVNLGKEMYYYINGLWYEYYLDPDTKMESFSRTFPDR